MLLSEILGEAVMLLSLVALCTAGPNRILSSLVKNVDDTLYDSSPERDDFLLPYTAKSTATGSSKSSGQRATSIYSHYQTPYQTGYPYAYGSFASPPLLYTPNPYNYGPNAMTTPYPFHPMAGYYPYSTMNSLYSYSPMAGYYPYSAMNSLYSYNPTDISYFNPAITSPYGYHPMDTSYFNPAMNSFYPMVAPYPFPAMNSFYVPVNASSPVPPLPTYIFHAPMAPFSYLRPPMGYSPLYPPMGGSYYPMNSFYSYSAAMMPSNSFHPPMYPLSYLQPPMGYPLVYPAMNTMNPYNLMNPTYNPANPVDPADPNNPMTNPTHPMHPANSNNPVNPVNNPTYPMNPYNPMNPVNSLYNGGYFAYPFQASYQAGMYSSYFLPPYQPSAALQALYPPYGYAAGVSGGMAWSQFGGAAWNPNFAMGYGGYPLWPSQFAHMWPMHPYYQTAVPAQEGVCSFDRPFQCWGSFTCVTIDDICDKTFDCTNHADEDPRICIAGRRPDYGILVWYLALPDQQWMLQKLFNNVDPYTTAYALKLATTLGDLRWSLALTDENINNTKTVLQAVKNDDKEPLIALGMPASAWESVKYLMNSLLSTDFILE